MRGESRKTATTLKLQPVQLQVLAYLAHGNRYSNTLAAATTCLGITKGSAAQSLLVLERKRLLEKAPDSKDHRGVHLHLTVQGQDVSPLTVSLLAADWLFAMRPLLGQTIASARETPQSCVLASAVKHEMKTKIRSAGVVVTRQTSDGWRYLLLRVYRYWDFPKGIVEQGEDTLAAACREVREETGIERLEFVWGHSYWETEPYAAGKVARYYLALTEQSHVNLPISAELGRPEHHEFRWVSHGEGMALLGARLRPVLRWAHDLTTEKDAECQPCGRSLFRDRSDTTDKYRS